MFVIVGDEDVLKIEFLDRAMCMEMSISGYRNEFMLDVVFNYISVSLDRW